MFVEWVFDFKFVAASVAVAADMQRLVNIGDEVEQPGQGVGNLLVFLR